MSVERDTVFCDVAGFVVFLRVVVTVFVASRRVAARAASPESSAHAPPMPTSARHTAKIALNPFILV